MSVFPVRADIFFFLLKLEPWTKENTYCFQVYSRLIVIEKNVRELNRSVTLRILLHTLSKCENVWDERLLSVLDIEFIIGNSHFHSVNKGEI